MSDVENDIKIIDFGFSIYTPNDRKLTSFCGTPSYMVNLKISYKNKFIPFQKLLNIKSRFFKFMLTFI